MTQACSKMTNEELAILAKDDAEALKVLVVKNERFVYFLAHSFLKSRGLKELYSADFIEDLAQICREGIVKGVKNYDPKYRTKFLTYAAKIMRNDMLEALVREQIFRSNEGEDFPEEEDHSLEEYGEGYIDPLDDDAEALSPEDGSVLFEQDDLDDKIRPAKKRNYYYYFPKVTPEQEKKEIEAIKKRIEAEKKAEDEPEPESEDPKKKKNKKGPYDENNYKKTEPGWKYPVFHKTLHDMQMETVLRELYSDHFDAAQREYLIYRFGLKDLIPKTWKESAEHFNLRISYAKKIEKEALDALRGKLKQERLL